MASNIDDVVIVTVTKTSVSVSRVGFGTALWIGQIDVALQSERFKLYSSRQDLIDAGFPADHPAVLWAEAHLGNDNDPAQFALGRRIPGVAENDEVQITVADAGIWDCQVNGESHTYTAGASSTVQDIAAGLTASVNNGVQPVKVTQQAAPNDDKFDVTNIVGGGSHTIAIVAPGAGAFAIVNTAPTAPEVWDTAFNAINTASTAKQWYILNIEDRDDATITSAAAKVNAEEKIGIFQTRSDDMRTATIPNIGNTLKGLSYRRVLLFWKPKDQHLADASMAGIAAAAQLDAAGGVITWNLKTLTGVPIDDLTTDDKTNIKDMGGSYYIEIGGSGKTQTQSVEGEFMRVQTTLDWTKARVQEDIFGPLGSTPTKIDLDTTGIGIMESALKGRLDIGVTNGHYTRDFNPTTSAPNPEDIEENDKNQGILRNLIGVAKLAQAIRQVFVRVDLTV